MFKNFGASEYLLAKHGAKGEIGTLIGEHVAPPLNVVDAIGGTVSAAFRLDPELAIDQVKHLPLVGRIWYYWMGDGVDKLTQRREREAGSDIYKLEDWE
jgi:hypothetical protein